MSAAREAILAKVRNVTGGAAPTDTPAERIGEAAAVRPAFNGMDLIERFIDRATSEKVTATVERLASPEDLPAAVARYLAENNLEPAFSAGLKSPFDGLDWGLLDLKASIGHNELVAVTVADMAVAETGTLVYGSSPEIPSLFNFLPLHHLAVVRAEAVVGYMEEVWPRFAAMPRSLNLITGTSGTADIEGKNIRGAHGPRFMRIFLVGDAG